MNAKGGVVAFFPEKDAKSETVMTSKETKKRVLGSVRHKEEFILETMVIKIRSGGVLVETKNTDGAEKLDAGMKATSLGRLSPRFTSGSE